MLAPYCYKELVVKFDYVLATTSANTLIAVVHLAIYIFYPITSIYLLFSDQHFLLPFHQLTTNDTLSK